MSYSYDCEEFMNERQQYSSIRKKSANYAPIRNLTPLGNSMDSSLGYSTTPVNRNQAILEDTHQRDKIDTYNSWRKRKSLGHHQKKYNYEIAHNDFNLTTNLDKNNFREPGMKKPLRNKKIYLQESALFEDNPAANRCMNRTYYPQSKDPYAQKISEKQLMNRNIPTLGNQQYSQSYVGKVNLKHEKENSMDSINAGLGSVGEEGLLQKMGQIYEMQRDIKNRMQKLLKTVN